MKRTPLKKKSKSDIRKVQDDIWIELRRIKTNKDGDYCYTCGAGPLIGSNRQLGHGPHPKASLGAFLKFDLRVLEWQCIICNCRMSGMGAEFYKRKLNENGKEWMDKLEADRNVTVKAIDHYKSLLIEYEKM